MSGVWLAYSSDWPEGMGVTRITFTKNGGKPRFVISDKQTTRNAKLQGGWSVCDGDDNYQVLLIFDSNRAHLEEFRWVERFNWPDGREPRSKWKATNMNGFSLWQAKSEGSSGDGTDQGEARIRGDELRREASEATLGHGDFLNLDHDS
jgi:hypothetical protein